MPDVVRHEFLQEFDRFVLKCLFFEPEGGVDYLEPGTRLVLLFI